MTKDTQAKTQVSAGALRAAKQILDWYAPGDPDTADHVAVHIIDCETGVAELLDTLKDAPESPAPQGFDVKNESPHKFAKRMHIFLVKYLTWQSSREQAIAKCEEE
jgi:hypothetical protein